MTAEQILELAMVPKWTRDTSLPDIEVSLRACRGYLDGAEALTREVVRAELIRRLTEYGHKAPVRLVDAALPQPHAEDTAKPSGQGHPVELDDPEPWPEAVDGATLLDEIVSTLRRYVVLPEPAARAVALWVVHTFALAAADVSPILALTSPTKRCGKTTLLDICGALVCRPLGTANISAAALFRIVEILQPTFLIDEADTFLRAHEELRGIINAGNTRGARVVRTVGDDHEPREFAVFCPKAIAAIGTLPDTIADRAILIRLERRAPGETVERLRRRSIAADLLPLRRRATRWAEDHIEPLRAADPTVPDALNDRAADGWHPLLAIADAAGGEWAETARRAAVSLAGGDDTEAGGDSKMLLLADMKDIFGEREAVASAEIVAALVGLQDRSWAEWGRLQKPLTPNVLARLLKPFGVRPCQVRIGAQNVHAYKREALARAWERYLRPDPHPATATPLQPLGEKDFRQNATATADADVAVAKSQKPLGEKGCSGVAVAEGRSGGEEDDFFSVSLQGERAW